MSIQFTSNHPSVSDVLIIGGKDSAFTGSEKGGYGPFPKYSISREEISANDGTYLASKYTINIIGQATIKPDDSSSATIAGQRQSRVMGEEIIKLQFNRNKFPMVGNGVLEINAYSGSTNQIKFNDARLISIEIPEKAEENAGIHYSEYSFVFEAYNLDDTGTPDYLVSSVEESWGLSVNDGQFCYQGNNIDTDTALYKTYILTHNLSAVGIRKYNASSLDADGEPWRQAAKWIESRIVNSPDSANISSHINGDENGPKFSPFYMNSKDKKDDLKIELFSEASNYKFVNYKAYNHQRNASTDISGAGYSLTDTWVLAPENTKALHTISSSIQAEQTAPAVVVNINGTITGLSENIATSNINDKYTNAKAELNTFINGTKPYSLASNIYENLNSFFKRTGSSLNDNMLSKSIGVNKNTGEITWSVSFNNETFIVPFPHKNKISSERITINWNNSDRSVNVIAIIPVLGRAAGPVIQYFNTNKERTVSVNLDLVFKKQYRTNSAPTDVGESVIATYGFSGLVSSRSESWNQDTGAYNLTVEWVYK
jgi:hypothetical protein